MKYTIGLDIGIASVGWAVINNDKSRIENLGVRVFKKAEEADGKSLNLARREARGTRRRRNSADPRPRCRRDSRRDGADGGRAPPTACASRDTSTPAPRPSRPRT